MGPKFLFSEFLVLMFYLLAWYAVVMKEAFSVSQSFMMVVEKKAAVLW